MLQMDSQEQSQQLNPDTDGGEKKGINQTFNLLQEIGDNIWGVNLALVSADIEAGWTLSGGSDPSVRNSWVVPTSPRRDPGVYPNACRHRGPGGSSRTWPLISQKTLLTPGRDSGRVRRRRVRRSPRWVLGENREDLRVGELGLRRC